MTNVDSQRIREICDNTKAMAEAFSSIANTLANALELFIATQTETQNSNLTFEKDECAKEYEELGLKELKELIKADRKDEPHIVGKHADVIIIDDPWYKEEPKDEPQNHSGEATEMVKTEPTISKMEQVDEPQTYCGDFADRLAYERGVKHAWEVAQKVFNSTVTFYEAEDVAKQIDKDINVRSKNEPQTDGYISGEDFMKIFDEPQTERSER